MPEPAPSLSRRLVDLQAIGAIRRNEQTRVMLLGVLVGILGGVAAALFDGLTVLSGQLLLGTSEPSAAEMSSTAVVVGPLVGALVRRLEPADPGYVAAILCIVGYIGVLGGALLWRFRSGAWRDIELTGESG